MKLTLVLFSVVLISRCPPLPEIRDKMAVAGAH